MDNLERDIKSPPLYSTDLGKLLQFTIMKEKKSGHLGSKTVQNGDRKSWLFILRNNLMQMKRISLLK